MPTSLASTAITTVPSRRRLRLLGRLAGPVAGVDAVRRADRDGNGKVTREELEAFFRAADSGGQGFLSLSDLQEAFAPPPAAPVPGRAGRRRRPSSAASSVARSARSSPGPKLDDSAPDFTLKTNDGKDEVTLSKLIGPRPVVLVFGNSTCGPFRSQTGNIEKLHRRYKDRATFVMVYVREAHPTDGWRMATTTPGVGVATAAAPHLRGTCRRRADCGRMLGLGFPMLVDTIDDRPATSTAACPAAST